MRTSWEDGNTSTDASGGPLRYIYRPTEIWQIVCPACKATWQENFQDAKRIRCPKCDEDIGKFWLDSQTGNRLLIWNLLCGLT